MSAAVFWSTAAVVTIAAISDVRSRRIPNWLLAPYLAVGFLVQYMQQGSAGLWRGAAGFLLAALATGFLYYLGGLGMGDCKLLVAIGVWIGPEQMLFALLGTALAGGLQALVYVTYRGALLRSLSSTASVMATVARRGFRPHPTANLANPEALKVPYGLAIAVGTIFSFYTQ